jgi:hypothetical protein
LDVFHTVQAVRDKIFQDLIAGDLGLKKKKCNGSDLRTPEERGGSRKHLFLQQYGDRCSKKGAIGTIGKKATKA